jgi:hypothetical protein
MCEPVTIMGGLAAAGAATSIMGQMQAHKAGESVEEARRIEQENMIAENRRRTTNDYLTQTRLERDQQSQEEAAVAMKGADIAKETRRTVATGTASAAERGVSGRTIDDIAADYDFQANEETGRLKQNQADANRQHEEAIKGYGTQYSNRIADVRPYVKQPVKPVDYFGPIFGAASQTLGTGVASGAFKASP